MASSTKLHFSLFFAFSLFIIIQATLGTAELVCEELEAEQCSFAVASSGKRCVLEKYREEYTCKTSEVVVASMACHMESDECVKACGVDRRSVGISSDAFLSPEFAQSICSPDCYQNCPNIVDLYFNLAAAEGVFLPLLCEKHRLNNRREMLGLMISSAGITVDISDISTALAPSPTPSS